MALDENYLDSCKYRVGRVGMKVDKHLWSNLLVLSLLIINPQVVSSQNSSPQEIKTSSAESVMGYDGVTYQNVSLGISFSKFKSLANASHHNLLPNREIEEDGVQIVYKAADEWSLGSFKWKPSFCFIEEDGVYRLATIRGTISDFATYKNVISVLDSKYGTHSVRAEKLLWKIGRRTETAVMLEDSLPGWLYFHDISLLKLGLEKKRNSTPGL